jgi:Cu/Ag efflux protein CusF
MRTANAFAAIALAVASTLTFAEGMSMPGKAAASAPTMPLVQAEVRKVDLQKGMVVLRHGEIPNLAMPAMTMGFDVADQRMLDGLKAGDKVRFQAEMVKGKATVTELKRE